MKKASLSFPEALWLAGVARLSQQGRELAQPTGAYLVAIVQRWRPDSAVVLKLSLLKVPMSEI